MIFARVKYEYASGLGNRLWPWARCRLFSELHGIPMLRTTWAWPMRLGPLVKQRMDIRSWPGHLYLGQFRSARREVGGLRRLGALVRLPELPEPDDLAAPYTNSSDGIVRFTGEGRMFGDLIGREATLRGALRELTRPRWLAIVDRPREVPIGIHVRRSDFKRAASASDFVTKGLLQTPLGWFIETLRSVRAAMGSDVEAIVVSDGKPEELADLLAEPATRLFTPASPISDMLVLSRARVLIGSGGSSFSAWASYLGEMPAVTHPGQSLRWFKLAPQRGQYLGEFDPVNPPAEFLDQVRTLGTARR